jgi:hypothetical protein
MLTKSQLITAIRELNPTAGTRWLGRFDIKALRGYLEHLHYLLGPRCDGWIRRGETTAVVGRHQTC